MVGSMARTVTVTLAVTVTLPVTLTLPVTVQCLRSSDSV